MFETIEEVEKWVRRIEQKTLKTSKDSEAKKEKAAATKVIKEKLHLL